MGCRPHYLKMISFTCNNPRVLLRTSEHRIEEYVAASVC